MEMVQHIISYGLQVEGCFRTGDTGATNLTSIVFLVLPGDDDLCTIIRELERKDPKFFQVNNDKVASQPDSQYNRALEISTFLQYPFLYLIKRLNRAEFLEVANQILSTSRSYLYRSPLSNTVGVQS